ncbi:cytochrome c3 family protein [Desulfoluna sp.]|uniref:cytochrome c3 family protein n=1 Tax=Desulfoluna sp. TaxID=2045199 RepID=UPI0026123213|nr:cytochrome c3 family protein [Desulfoluna sp.]
MILAYRALGVFLVAILLTAGPLFASVLDESLDTPRTRPLSHFEHDSHNEIAELEESCALCHHLFDDNGALLEDESSEEMACRDCHEGSHSGMPKTEAAFHNRCKGCHLAIRQGPIACGECHSGKEE